MEICVLNGSLLEISCASGSCIHSVWRCFWGKKEFYIRTEKGKDPRINNIDNVPDVVLNRTLKSITNREYIR